MLRVTPSVRLETKIGTKMRGCWRLWWRGTTALNRKLDGIWRGDKLNRGLGVCVCVGVGATPAG